MRTLRRDRGSTHPVLTTAWTLWLLSRRLRFLRILAVCDAYRSRYSRHKSQTMAS